jgi:hypothetical protein
MDGWKKMETKGNFLVNLNIHILLYISFTHIKNV